MGRTDKLAELSDSLESSQAVAISALTGMGGIGKSELALQYALQSYEVEKYPGGICWLEVRAQNVGSQILEFARVYLGLADKIVEGELSAQVESCYRQWLAGEVLLVFDDVVDFGEIKDHLSPAIDTMCISYPTDLSEDQWYLIEPVLPEAKSGGRPRSTNLRHVINAILYVLMGGIAWRLLPHDFPKWQTVYHYFRQWRDDDRWQQINQQLHQWERTAGHDRLLPLAMGWWILSRWIPQP